MVGSILNPNQCCFAISAAMGSIRNPKQYCFAIIAAMGSIQNPKQYCFATSSITTHKVLTSWMHEASHWKCQCRILTARISRHGKKMCRPWSQLAGNMPGHLALIRGNEKYIGDYNLIFFVFFLWYGLWSLLASRGRAQYILWNWLFFEGVILRYFKIKLLFIFEYVNISEWSIL